MAEASAPWSADHVKAAIVASGVVGIVRTTGTEAAISLARQLWSAGVDVVEVALTTPGGIAAIESLSADLTGRAGVGVESRRMRVLGAGTVLDAESARLAILAGARLLVTPTLVEAVIEVGQRYNVATVIGCSTPSEMLRATSLGADLVKVFPASLWSPRSLADVLAALPQLDLVPTGGIAPEDAARWIEAGACAVGLGSGLTRGDDPAARVKALLASIRQVRSSS